MIDSAGIVPLLQRLVPADDGVAIVTWDGRRVGPDP